MTEYGIGTSAADIQKALVELREDYPTGDKGTIIFVREVMDVLADMLEDDNFASVC